MKGHGEYNLTVNENIIRLELVGSFNIETARVVYRKLKKIIKTFKNKPYYIIENITHFLGATPEAYEVANKDNGWINQFNPPVMRLFIVSNTIHTSIALKQEKELAKQNLIYFNDEESALEWISEDSK